MLIMTFFILPQFQDIFADAGAKLPLLTRMVFALNKFLVAHALVEFVVTAPKKAIQRAPKMFGP